MKKPIVLIFMALLLSMAGCVTDGIDFSKLSDEVNLSPEFVTPVAKANISVWDLMQAVNKENRNLISKDPNGLIKIMYRQNDLFKYNVRDLLNFPVQQNFSSGDKPIGEIQPGSLSVSHSITLADLNSLSGGGPIDLNLFNGQTVPYPPFSYSGAVVSYKLSLITDFTSVTFSKGFLEISLENKLKVPVTFKGYLFDAGNNAKIKDDFTFTNVAPNASSKVSLDMTGVQLSNNLEFRMISYSTPGSVTPVVINKLDFIKLSANLLTASITKGNLLVKSQTVQGASGAVSFTFPQADLKAYSCNFKRGTLTIKTTNTSKITGSINLTLSEFKKNGLPIQTNVPLNGTAVIIDLAGAALNLASDPVTPYNRVPYTYTISVNSSSGYVSYASTDIIKLDMTLSSLDFKSILGDFGKQSIQIAPGTFDLNVDVLDKVDANFKLANPRLELIFRNSIGTPANVGFSLAATSKSGQQVALTRNPATYDIPVPASINAGIATGTMDFTKLNSNIVNFIALPPSGQIKYSGKVDLNKNNVVTPQNPNFLDLDATFAIDVAMELPIELQISNLAIKDTSSISGDNYNNLVSGDLILNSTNGVPLDVDVQLLFVDTLLNKQYGSSKKMKILSAAQVGSDGKITPTKSSQTFSLDQTDMDNLRKSNAIIFSGSVSSPSGGTGVASLYSDSRIDLNVVIKAKINL
jgi:hypothetical protein